MQRGKKETGLSKQVSSLSATVNNAYTVGSIIGYSIVDSLKDYTPSNISILKEKQIQEEIEKVYTSLETVIKKSQHESGNNIILELENRIKDYVYKLRKNSTITESIILKEFAKKLQSSEGNPEDIVSRKGLSFLINFRMKGSYVSSNQSINDFESIINYFAK